MAKESEGEAKHELNYGNVREAHERNEGLSVGVKRIVDILEVFHQLLWVGDIADNVHLFFLVYYLKLIIKNEVIFLH